MNEELASKLPILKVFANLLDSGGKEWKWEVFVTDKNLDTYKVLWNTPKGVDPDSEEVMKEIQFAFLIDKMKGMKDFEKVEDVN